ncbi:MAG: hypothetical protein ACYTDW_07190 [Planctomycetota bacterium]|jgi:hypothetical protein
MNSNLKRKIERLEQAVGLSGYEDSRAYSYPNTLVEAIHMAHMSEDKLQEHLRTRRNRPSSQVCDMFDRAPS